jgi:glycosyltransferase involved in cell wall biosynthesis
MPSRWEGFSSAALQAASTGVPCIFSAIPSFKSQFPNSFFKFHRTESESDLSEKIAEVLMNGTEASVDRQKYIKNNYSIEKMADEYSHEYASIQNNQK